MLDEKNFKLWMKAKGYQQTTIYSSIPVIRSAEEIWKGRRGTGLGDNDNGHYDALAAHAPILRRYGSFLLDMKICDSAFDRYVLSHYGGIPKTRGCRKKGARHKEELNAADFERLAMAIYTGCEPTDLVLCVVLACPDIPVSSLLEMRLNRIAGDLPGLRDRLLEYGKSKPLFSILCGGSACAHKQIQRRLKEYADSMGLEVDFHCLARTPRPSDRLVSA